MTEVVAADVDEALAGLKARRFILQLAGTGVFGGNWPHTLWLGVERNPDLMQLHDKIELALIRVGLEPEGRRDAPPVTLAQLRRPGLDHLGHFPPPHPQFRPDTL